MSYQSPSPRVSGTVADDANSTAMQWDLTPEQGRAVHVITVTCSRELTLHIREARTAAELDAPPLDLPHEITETIPANETRRIVVGTDPSLPHGRAWLANASSASANYVLDGGRRAHS